MYIQVTVDLNKYNQDPIELRLSDQHTVKSLVDIAWQTKKLTVLPREGYWIRIQNKDLVFTGALSLADCGITTGDRVEVL